MPRSFRNSRASGRRLPKIPLLLKWKSRLDLSNCILVLLPALHQSCHSSSFTGGQSPLTGPATQAMVAKRIHSIPAKSCSGVADRLRSAYSQDIYNGNSDNVVWEQRPNEESGGHLGPEYIILDNSAIAIITIAIADCKANSHLHAATGPNMATLTYIRRRFSHTIIRIMYHRLWLMQAQATVWYHLLH